MVATLNSLPLSEIIGYSASVCIFVSFLMKKIKNLRIINSMGCCLFICYGVCLDYSIPIIITNLGILLINLCYLFNIGRSGFRNREG